MSQVRASPQLALNAQTMSHDLLRRHRGKHLDACVEEGRTSRRTVHRLRLVHLRETQVAEESAERITGLLQNFQAIPAVRAERERNAPQRARISL